MEKIGALYDKKYSGWGYEKIYADNPSGPKDSMDNSGESNQAQQQQDKQNGQQQGKGSGGSSSSGNGQQQQYGEDYKKGWAQAMEDYKKGKLKL